MADDSFDDDDDDLPPKAPRPVPGLDAQPVTLDQFLTLIPEKFELMDGYLFYGPADTVRRRDLLSLLLTNEGLLEAVKLAPPEVWRAALQQVYGEA